MSWKTCTSCRKAIDYSTTYWECSVSTCNRKRLGLFFCSVACWDAHVPDARHREAWAIEKRSPSQSESERQDTQVNAPKRVVASASSSSQPTRRAVVSATSKSNEDLPGDVLVVVSKLKKYVKAKSDMKTSENVIPVLSQELRRICDRAIRIAGQNGRKTILDRDVRDALKE